MDRLCPTPMGCLFKRRRFMKSISRTVFPRLAVVTMLALASLSCELNLIDWGQIAPTTSPPGTNNGPTATPAAMAETTFNLTLPAPLNPGESLAIGILDEVTGLGLNPVLYPMKAVDAQHYSVALPLALNATVKYRYYKQGGLPAQENTALGQAVRYRLHTVSGPAVLNDILAAWSGQAFNGPVGRISGTIIDAASGRPVPNILVVAGGEATLTDSLGQYVLESLPEGTQNINAYAMDGMYASFEQGAEVRGGLTTTAPISMKAATSVQVTFVVNVPQDTVSGAPLRLAGNLLQLGNTFADLNGGISTVASRMPTLTPLEPNRYSMAIRLPVGADIRYKYTLGDGFWNAEHSLDGNFVIRQFIVPTTDVVIQDTVASWQAGTTSAPILFEVVVPANTPASDTVSIQFNPYGWTEAIPMWPLGNNHWVYKLFSPLNMLGSFHYRYCRNDQCGSADDTATAGQPAVGRSVSTSLTGQNIQDAITAWAWWPDAEPVTLVAVPVHARQTGFWAGVELQNSYQPNWQGLYPSAMQNIQALGANTLILSPTWTATSYNPLVFAPTPGSDPLWTDMLQAVQYGRAQNLNVALYAQPRYLPSAADFWAKAPRTADWWDAWFQRYRAFAIYHADLAAQSGTQALILGGEAVLPALPGGTLADGSSSNVPADAEKRWRDLLTEVRKHFPGQLLWAHPYKNQLPAAPVFIDQFDAFYLLWSAPLATSVGNGVDFLSAEASRRLDTDIMPMLQTTKKPAVLALDYPSAQGAAAGCVPSGGGGCLDWNVLNRPYPDTPSASLDLKGQADLYQAMLQAINERDWIGGFVSRGYYPAVSLMDKSPSVRSKMTADLLWYWFPRLTGVTK